MDEKPQLYRGVKLCSPQSVCSGLMHYGGMAAALVASIILVVHSVAAGHPGSHVAAYAIFGLSMVLLYGASATYHVFYISPKVHRVLKKIDHCMVFVLIAGTYTPIGAVALGKPVGWILLTVVWVLAVAGMVMKAVWIEAPTWLSVLCYVLLGWAAIFVIAPLYRAISAVGVALLLTGGVLYTVGAFIYKAKRQYVNMRYFGNHEIFHVLIILASCCMYVVIYRTI